MFSDDRFHPTNNDDTYLKELIEKKINSSKKHLDETKRSCEVITSCFGQNSNNKMKVKCYRSGEIGNLIVDSVTGAVFSGHNEQDKLIRHLVGSKYEDLYFKVKDGSNTFFYHSPEEFEKHQYNELSEEVKSKWREKYTAMQYKHRNTL